MRTKTSWYNPNNVSISNIIIIPYENIYTYNTDYNVITITELENLGWAHCYSGTGIIVPLAISQDLIYNLKVVWQLLDLAVEVANLENDEQANY